MDITPKLHLWESRRNDRLGWHDCIAELIDNSFDAGATRAVIEWRDGKFAIEDDGKGMPDISAAVQFGSHCKHGSEGVGMYGIGVKDAWAWLSHTIDIRTTRGGKTSTVKVCQSNLIQQDGRWIAPDPTVRDALPGEVGTRIAFGPLFPNRSKPQRETFDRLSETFMPAMLSGKQIVYVVANRRVPLVPYRMPAMQEAIEESFSVDGKSVSIRIGIAQEGEYIGAPGFLIAYRHRVIKRSDIGTKHYNAGRMVGIVTLGTGWGLTPHKTDLSEQNDALEDAIFERIEPMLQREDAMSQAVESNAIRLEIETMVNESVREINAKEKRPNKGTGKKGTVVPQATGRKRRNASMFDELQRGSVETKAKRKRGFCVKWCNMGTDLLGQCFADTGTVQLNLDNPFVKSMKQAGNKAALFAIAVGLLCHADDMIDGPQKLIVCKGEFAQSWGTIMSGIKIEEPSSGSA